MFSTPGEQVLATILKHDSKTTSYKIALLRALNDLALFYPDVAPQGQDVAVPLKRLAELWAAYYWPFADEEKPIYQGARAVRQEITRQDVSFRPALAKLKVEWRRSGQLNAQTADGYFLLTEMRIPRRRATYTLALQQAYDQAVGAITVAIKMPIQHAGPGHWSVFTKPMPARNLPSKVLPLPGTELQEVCVIVPASLWETFHRLSLYVEALCIHEWCLFTERVEQAANNVVTRGDVYALLTARPDNRRPLSWERNQIDVLLYENVAFTCPWTQRLLTQPQHYDLDHLLPLAIYPVNELWNLVPVDRTFNQHIKRDRIPSTQRLIAAEPFLATAYSSYLQLPALQQAMYEDAIQRFAGLRIDHQFAPALANRAICFIDEVAASRYVTRF